MRTAWVSIAAVAAAIATPASAEGQYTVRNETARAFTCGLRREDRSIIDRFVLKAGEEWRQSVATNGERVLLCDSWVVTPRWRMRSGVAYRLVEEPRTGRVVLVGATVER